MDYVISDLHIGHKRICEFEPVYRPFSSLEEHDNAIVERWNSVVTPDDKVYLLGDAFFRAESAPYIQRMMGRKILIMGNHDHYVPINEYGDLFWKVYGAFAYGGQVIMTHIPVHTSQLEHRFKLNLHGHVHSHTLADRRYVNCSAEAMNLTPTPLVKLIDDRLKELKCKD